MFITPAYAQSAGGGGGDLVTSLLPLVAIIAIFYFLMIRPQQKRMKAHREMVSNVSRGDTIVTGGGIIGKVTKAKDDTEVEVEISEGVKVRIIRQNILEVRAKTEPVKKD